MKQCAVSTRAVRNDINFISEWSRQLEILDKIAYGFLPELVNTLTALFTIDVNIFHGFTFNNTSAEHIRGLEHAQ